eukprot:6490476-Amphidinium_carterae.2
MSQTASRGTVWSPDKTPVLFSPADVALLACILLHGPAPERGKRSAPALSTLQDGRMATPALAPVLAIAVESNCYWMLTSGVDTARHGAEGVAPTRGCSPAGWLAH